MIDLNGSYTHNVDAKGRLSLPAKFRKKILEGTSLVATLDLAGKCIYVFEEEGFNEWVLSFFVQDGGYNPRNQEHVALRTALKERAEDVTQDANGRINLPASMREAVGITKEVKLIGNTGYFEIWDAKRREEAAKAIDLTAFLI